MARTAGSFAVLGLLGGLVWSQQAGCDPDNDTELEFTEVLNAVGPEVVQPKLERFEADARALSDAIDSWAADPAQKGAAQQAWDVAMASWHEVDPLRLGPLGQSVGTEGNPASVGGENWIDSIYSWPTVNSCLVDQNTVSRAFEEPDWFDTALVNAYGLDEIGQLLFAGPENDCPGQVPINSTGSWDALGEAGVDEARADYAAVLAGRVVTDVEDALAAWSTFTLDEDTYGNEQLALNAVFDALYSLEISVADRKLAEPFGERNCVENCLEMVEARNRGGGSHKWVAANLRGVRDLFTGGQGAGMDDLLADRGQGDLSDEFLSELDQAIAAADAVAIPLDQLFVDDPAAALALLTEVREASDVLEDDVRTVLSLSLPSEVGGDLD